MIRCLAFIFHLVIVTSVMGQGIAEKEVIERALNFYPGMRLAEIDVRQKKELERTAFNPSQPQFVLEFPSDLGVNFEAEQEFDFPGVYTARSRWLKSETLLATKSASLTRNEVIRDVRLNFLDAQFLQAQVRHLRSQDSLWKEIANKSQKLFEGGEINKADMMFAEKQASVTSFTLMNTIVEYESALSVLNQFSEETITRVQALSALPYEVTDTAGGFYFDDYMIQQKMVVGRKADVVRMERLPGLIIGYLRVDEPETEFRYRYKAGITVPIWQGQYKGEIESAKLEIEKINAQSLLQSRQARNARLQWINKINQTNLAIDWFESNALPQMMEMIDVYMRLFEAGETDYAITLRNIADALDTRVQYLETIRQHNEAIIQLEFLNGVN